MHHAISTKTISEPTCVSCHQIEHRALKLASPAFHTPTAHVIFVPSKGTPEQCVCILCEVRVGSDAQEFHLSGKRHARNMKKAKGPRACACSAPVVVQPRQGGVATMRDDVVVAARVGNKRLDNIQGRNSSRRKNQRHKMKRCGQRSYVAAFMKLGRAGLFPKYVRDSEYHVRPFKTWVKPPHILAANLSPLGRFYSPPKKAPLLLDGIQLTEKFFALLRNAGMRGCVIWSNALPYIGRFIRHTLARPPKIALGAQALRQRRDWFLLDALAAPSPVSARKKGRENTKKGVQTTGVRKIASQKAGMPPMQGPKPKSKKQPQQEWHCDVCDKNMPQNSMETHLQGRQHARKAGLPVPPRMKVKAKAPASQVHGGAKGVQPGVRSLRPRGGAPCMVVR